LLGQRSLVISLNDELAKTKLQIGIDPNAPAKVEELEKSIARIQRTTGDNIETIGNYTKANLDALRVEQQRIDALNQLFARDNDNITQKTRLIDLTGTQNEQTITAIKLAGELAAQQRIQQEQLKLGKDGQVSAEQQAKIRAEQQQTTDQLVKNAQEQIDKSREFGTGWAQAYKQYAEDANNASKQAQGYFSTFTKGFEDAIVNFVKTGKLSFKDLANSIISDFVRIQAKQLALGLFGGGGTGSGVGNFFSMLSGIPGKAKGGPVSANTPYMVGENGPELFLSKSAGTIVPNNQLSGSRGGSGTNIVYNIVANDAASFRQMIARDPEFLYAVTEKGRSSIPSGRR
jgi:lambda family phage tail tape measure protein